MSPLFVGRGAEFAALGGALRRSDSGRPEVLLIGGEAGVGKTRLLEEFQHTAEAAGALVAVGGCLEVGAEGLPYAPFASILRRLHRELGAELLRAAEGYESNLARILPDLGEAPAESHDAFARARLFEHTAQLFERLTAERTLVLAVEDLHWSDRSTRELLAYLIRTMHRGRLLLIGTYRSDDLHRRHPVRPYLAELERLRTVQRLELCRLDRREVARQLAGILQPLVPERDLVHWVFERSDGNPFFVEELAASHQQGAGHSLTDSLRDLLLVRVEALSEDSQGILRVLAEGGSAVEHGLLSAVLARPEEELTEGLRAAVGSNIIQPSADSDGYRFRHALVREAVSDDLMPGERSRINRRYAAALAADPALVRADQRAARLADYWYNARDAARALPAALEAGREARRRNAFAEQLGMLARVIELWDDVPAEVLAELRCRESTEETYPVGDSRLRLVDVLAEASFAALLSGELDRGLRFVRKALRIVDERQDPHRAAWFLMQRGRAVRYSAGGTVREDIDHALRLVDGPVPTPVLADVLNRLACEGMLAGSSRADIATAKRAIEVARASGARSTELHARLTLGMLHYAHGEYEQGAAQLNRIIEQAVETQDVELLARVHINLSSHHQAVGSSTRAVDVGREGLAMIRRNGMTAYSGTIMLGNVAEALISLGRVDEARQLLTEEPFGAGREAHSDFVERLRGDLALLGGDTATAAKRLAGARSAGATGPGQPQKFLPVAALAIRIARREGRFTDARAELEAGLGAGPTNGHQREYWALLFEGASTEADGYELPAMQPGRPAVLARIGAAVAALRPEHPLAAGWSVLLRAELARAERRDGAADWLAAAEAVRGFESPGLRGLALHRAAEALAPAGERDRAQAVAAESLALARCQGDRFLEQQLLLFAERARLRLDGAPAEPAADNTDTAADADAGFRLTPREQSVLQQLALGRTNRQIAAELFISPKTASVHVSNILAKLEVASRGEAAAMAHRLHLVG